MHGTIISNTSCFIVLHNIGELNLLNKIYGQITTTLEVAKEFDQSIPDWVEIKSPATKYFLNWTNTVYMFFLFKDTIYPVKSVWLVLLIIASILISFLILSAVPLILFG